MTWGLFQRWSHRRHLRQHERERKELETRVRELEEMKMSARRELDDLEYHEKAWNSIQLDK